MLTLVAWTLLFQQDAVSRMRVADGFEVNLVASEPQIRQPVTMSFDDRGRIWVIQYLQYPTPAGLKAVKVDEFLRTVYDRVPEPPPNGPKGADRITILEDPDGDGFFDRAKDFVADLNLASGMALGHGGVFVAQPPYLLFYPDRDRNDIPDGDPEVLLTGFGMEDAHAFANSLQFGPDGWLYGAHGSTVTAKIRGIEFQQGIWRYHPTTKEFELFAEGGGNTWGLDFDRHGNIIAGTNWGGEAMLHQVQGGYYVKGFAKHGPLHNPYTFGYFGHVPYTGFKGGHVTCGGVIYRGGAFPNDVYIAANPLSNAIHWHILEPKGSSFTARHGGELLTTDDKTFRPVDCLVGPDGALYIADWCDPRLNHVDPRDTWDRSNGRIYRVRAKGATKIAPPRLTDEDERTWSVRRAGDARRFMPEFVDLARSDPSPRVRSQLASTAKRLKAAEAIPIIRELLKRDEDVDDPHIPLLLWWAIEDKAISDRETVLGLFDDAELWKRPIVRRHIAERLARRYMAAGDYEACARFLSRGDAVVKGMEVALEGRRLERVPAALEKHLAELPVRLALRLGSEEAYARALEMVADRKAKDRVAMIEAVGQSGLSDCIPVLVRLLEGEPDGVRTASLSALQSFNDPRISEAVLEAYPKMAAAPRRQALGLLTARAEWSRELLGAVEAGKIAVKDVPFDQVRRIAAHGEAKRVEKLWGRIASESAGENRVRSRNVDRAIREGKGDPGRGRELFAKTCGVCHTLFGEGNKIGPELTGADRRDRELMIRDIVDPSAVIRPEFQAWLLQTGDGRVLSGLIAEESPQAVTLLDAQNARTVIAREKIESMKASAVSLMPEKLLDSLSDQEQRDLFSHLQAEAPQGALPGTKPLEMSGDLASQMVDGIHRFLDRETAASIERRATLWKRDLSSREAYEKSVEPNRARLRKYIGAVDAREPFEHPEKPAAVIRGQRFEAYEVRWPVFRNVQGEGLLLVPIEGKRVADVVVIPDADQTPEMLAGLSPGLAPEAQIARRLAESGCRVIVPVLIDRGDTHSVGARATNQPHREFVYRPAFEMGRHIIGYEVQKVLALVDWLARTTDNPVIGVHGYGEGALLALYSAALDPRIDAACVSGYFGPRQGVWQEPIYRNIFGLLSEFGDAELASLVAPRTLIVEPSAAPAISGPPAPRQGRSGAAPGRIETPTLEAVKKELERAHELIEGLQAPTRLDLTEAGKGLETFLDALSPGAKTATSGEPPQEVRDNFDPAKRHKRQFDQLVEDTQRLMRESENARRLLWSKADKTSLEKWEKSTEAYREHFATEVIGRFELPVLPPNVRTRKIYDEPKYTGYEVVLDVFADVFASGILLVPKGIPSGERRPVVVCQHGLEGRPRDLADPKIDNKSYNQYGCRLAERGFVVYAPQNPYIFTDRFRSLQRKLNPLKKTLFSIIVPQHRATVDWLASLPFVDPERIAFYGLSYGGKTAMRVPPLVGRYCLSICSADFNEWIWKNASTSSPFSYVTTGEYEIFEFDLANTYNYSEMAALIAPRPFMVERGHRDGVAPDEWVAYEYAKVRRLYADLKIPGRTAIEFFDGPHTIHGVGTFDFLHDHLNWPRPGK